MHASIQSNPSRSLRVTLGAALILIVAGGAVAQQPNAPGNFLAVGAATVPDFTGADDQRIVPFAAARWATSSATLQLRGTEVSADFLERRTGGTWGAGVLAAYRFGREPIEQAGVARDGTDDALELGGFVARHFRGIAGDRDRLTARISALADVTDSHDGYLIEPALIYSASIGDRLRIESGLSATFGDETFQDAYFGLDAAGITGSLIQAFEPDGGFFQVGASATGRYQFSRRWSFLVTANYSRLTGDAGDTPLLGIDADRDQFRAGLALAYGFR